MPRVGDAREDWTIIRALSEIMGKPLPYDDKNAVRARLAGVAPHFGASDTVQIPMWLNGEYFKVRASCRRCPGVLQGFLSIILPGKRAHFHLHSKGCRWPSAMHSMRHSGSQSEDSKHCIYVRSSALLDSRHDMLALLE